MECDAHEPPVVMLFGRVYAADAVVGPAKFHGWGMVSVRGIGAVQALFLMPWDGDDVGWRGVALGVRMGSR